MRNEIMKMGVGHTPGISFSPPWQHYFGSYEQWGDWQTDLLIIFKLSFAQLSVSFFLFSSSYVISCNQRRVFHYIDFEDFSRLKPLSASWPQCWWQQLLHQCSLQCERTQDPLVTDQSQSRVSLVVCFTSFGLNFFLVQEGPIYMVSHMVIHANLNQLIVYFYNNLSQGCLFSSHEFTCQTTAQVTLLLDHSEDEKMVGEGYLRCWDLMCWRKPVELLAFPSRKDSWSYVSSKVQGVLGAGRCGSMESSHLLRLVRASEVWEEYWHGNENMNWRGKHRSFSHCFILTSAEGDDHTFIEISIFPVVGFSVEC